MAKKSNDALTKAKKELKSLGDKVAKGSKKLGKTVAKGSKKLYSMADLNVKKAKLENDNIEYFYKLGMLTYKKGGLTGKAAELGDKIKDNKKAITKINAQLKTAKPKK